MTDANSTSSSGPQPAQNLAPAVAEAASTPTATSASENTGVSSSSSSTTNTSSSSAPTPSSLPHRKASSEAHQRAVRFGLVFTQLGAASKEEVFPHGVRHMPRLLTLKEVTEGKLRRQSLEELDEKIRRTRSWWWPFSWFGPPTAEEVEYRRREAQRRADEAARKKLLKATMDKAAQAEDERRIEELNRKIAESKAQQKRDEEESTASTDDNGQDDGLVEPLKPPRLPLKVDIDPRALTTEEEASLSTNVANQRMGILESEKQIHQMMDAVEKTRMQYLRAAPGKIKCEREIVSVLSCYEEAKFKASTGNRAAALKCGPAVDLLEACAQDVARAHIRQ